MRHERQVFYETARLSFRRVTRTQHAPLTRLKRTRTGHLACLFELRGDTSHHAQGRNERQSTEHVRDSGALHLETLEGPVASRDGAHEPLRDAIAVQLELFQSVKFLSTIGLLENFVNVGLEVVVELFEQVFEQERE